MNEGPHGDNVPPLSLSSIRQPPCVRQEEKGLGDVNVAWKNPSRPGGGLPDGPTYDMMLTVDAVHDMARPDQVLPLVRKVSLCSAGPMTIHAAD